MVRGTTPTLEFVLPFTTDLIDEVYITIKQSETQVIEKQKDDCICDDTKLTCKLTQEETLSLIHNKNVEIQLRVKTTDGDVMASQIIKVYTDRILKEGVI